MRYTPPSCAAAGGADALPLTWNVVPFLPSPSPLPTPRALLVLDHVAGFTPAGMTQLDAWQARCWGRRPHDAASAPGGRVAPPAADSSAAAGHGR